MFIVAGDVETVPSVWGYVAQWWRHVYTLAPAHRLTCSGQPPASRPPQPRSYPTPVTSLSAWDTANFVKRSLFTHPRVLRDAGMVWFSYEYQQKFALRGLIFRAFKLSWLFLSWGNSSCYVFIQKLNFPVELVSNYLWGSKREVCQWVKNTLWLSFCLQWTYQNNNFE